jgi:hypothetical protein
MSLIGWTTPFPAANATASTPAPEPIPIVGIGVVVIDSTGKLSGPGTVVSGPDVIDYDIAEGSIQLNPDCTGIMRYKLSTTINGALVTIPTEYVERVILMTDKQEMITVSIKSPLSRPAWITTFKRVSTALIDVKWQ